MTVIMNATAADDPVEALAPLFRERDAADDDLAKARDRRDGLARDLAQADLAVWSALTRRERATAAIAAILSPVPSAVQRQGGHRSVDSRDGVHDPAKAARLAGYEGEACPACGELKLVRSGRHAKCDGCGWEYHHTVGCGLRGVAAVRPSGQNEAMPQCQVCNQYPCVCPKDATPSGQKPKRSRRKKAADALPLPPDAPLVLPCHETAEGYAFLDPGDVSIAATAGLPASFGWGDFDRMKATLKAATGRELIAHPKSPQPLPPDAPRHLTIRCDADGWCRPAEGEHFQSDLPLPIGGSACFPLDCLEADLKALADKGVNVDLLPAADCDEETLLRVKEVAIASGSRGVCMLPPGTRLDQPSLFASVKEGNVP